MTQTRQATDTTPLTNLWVLLVQNDGELTTQDADGRVPMMARAGNDQKYLLVFKNVVKARITNPDAHLLCFQVSLTPVITPVWDQNQFGTGQLAIGQTRTLCLPSSKVLIS